MKLQDDRDFPVVIPRRRPSLCTVPNPALLEHACTFSRTSPLLYSPESSIQVLDSCKAETFKSSFDFHLTSDDESVSLSSLVAKKVRFAPWGNSTVSVMGLADYSSEELVASWYSYDDIKCMRRRSCKKTSQSSKKSKPLRCPELKKADKRWSA